MLKNAGFLFRSQRKKGQAFFEYIALLAVITTLALVTLKGINGALGDLWLNAVRKIAYPTKGVDFRQ